MPRDNVTLTAPKTIENIKVMPHDVPEGYVADFRGLRANEACPGQHFRAAELMDTTAPTEDVRPVSESKAATP